MPDVSVLDILLYSNPIGTLTNIQGDRNLFAFNQDYIDNAERPTLSLSFKDSSGGLITNTPPTQTSVPTFFSNLLPEGSMRDYLAERAGVNVKREFFLLWVLGEDLPGAITIKPVDGDAWPPDIADHEDEEAVEERKRKTLRFSLAGVQLKFSAVRSASGELTVPAKGVGGSWIVKLPSMKFEGIPENEFSMMTLATQLGMDVPEIKLVDIADIGGMPNGIEGLKGQALAVKRFDRSEDGPIHIEDFAQIFGVNPDKKYEKASYRNIAEVLAAESGVADIAEFIRRLVFNTLIGNADMHLKNWSVIYNDRRNARLSPAYDFVSTIAYLKDTKAALTVGKFKDMAKFSMEELIYIAGKARLPEKLVIDTASETVEAFHQIWAKEKQNLPLPRNVISAIDSHLQIVPLANP